MDEIAHAAQERLWVLAECLVTLADPILLRTPGDPCALDRLTNSISPLLRAYLDERIKGRESEVENDARSADLVA